MQVVTLCITDLYPSFFPQFLLPTIEDRRNSELFDFMVRKVIATETVIAPNFWTIARFFLCSSKTVLLIITKFCDFKYDYIGYLSKLKC